MYERVTNNNAPKVIQELVAFPYWFISKLTTTVLDVGCGEQELGKMILGAIGVDIANGIGDIIADANRLPFANSSFTDVICFETIEHIETQENVVAELFRISSKRVWIGSVNKDGPNFINGIEIYKGNKNPYHIRELGISEFCHLFDRYKHKIFFQSKYNNKFYMKYGLDLKGYCNYVVLGKDSYELDISLQRIKKN